MTADKRTYVGQYVAQRTLAVQEDGRLPGAGPVVPRLSRVLFRHIGEWWEVEVKRLTGLDRLVGAGGQEDNVFDGPQALVDLAPGFLTLDKARLPPELPGLYHGELPRGEAELVVSAWNDFIDQVRDDVVLGGGFDAAGFATEAASRAWWSALAGMATRMTFADSVPHDVDTWGAFLQDLPASLEKAAEDAAAAAARTTAGMLGAFLGGLLTSPVGLLLALGATAYVFRADIARLARK